MLVELEAGANDVGLIVVTLQQHTAAGQTLSDGLGIVDMQRHIAPIGTVADAATTEAMNDRRFAEIEHNHGIDLPALFGQQRFEHLRLGHTARIPIEQAWLRRRDRVQPRAHQLGHQRVRRQLPLFEQRPNLLSDWSLRPNLGAQLLAGGNNSHPGLARQLGGDGRFARTGRADQENRWCCHADALI